MVNQSLVFKLMNLPDDSGYQLFLVPTTLENYALGLYLSFTANYLIKTHYNIMLTGPSNAHYHLTFTAKETGSIWTLQLINNGVSGLSQESVLFGVDPIVRNNYGILCSVWTSGAGPNYRGNAPQTIALNTHNDLALIGEDLKSSDKYGKVSFDISEYLRSYLKLVAEGNIRFTYPEIATQNVTQWPNHVVEYITSFAETYDNLVRKLYYDEIRYVLSGGLSTEALAYYNENKTDYFSVADNSKRFLTWAPVTKYTGKIQPEKLSFFVYGLRSPYSYRLAIRVKFTDGSYHSYYACDSASCSIPLIVELMVGYTHLGLAQIDVTREVESWEVWIEDASGSTISEVRKFILDTDFYEHERTFLFRNSFGRYDVIRFLGMTEASLAFERIAGQVATDEVITSFNTPSKNFETWETQTFKADSGYVSKEMHDYFREFLITTEAYEVVEGLLFPIVLKSLKINPFSTDGVYLYNLQVEYERAYDDQYYSGQFKPINMINTDDLTQGVGVIYEFSDDVTFFGYPQNGTTSETEGTWRIKRMQKTVVNGKIKHILKWADGNLNYDNQMSNAENLTYAFLNS